MVSYETMLNAKRQTQDANIHSKNYFRFEKFEVWKDAREFVSLIYKLTSKFLDEEKFGLINQIRRAALSIVLNIAEGSAKGSDLDLRRFLRMAQGSTNEVVSALYIALDLNLLSKTDFQKAYDFSHRINAKINSFIKALSVKRIALSN